MKEYAELIKFVELVVKQFSETEQFLAKRAEMGVPKEQKESLEAARSAVGEVVKAHRRLIRLFRTPQLSDRTLVEFYQNAAVVDWQQHQTIALRCLALAREMQYHARTQVALRSAEIQKRISVLKPVLAAVDR
jgi:ATP-dependent 26S proteasome regulatory subunit